jgi:hypothetical protein
MTTITQPRPSNFRRQRRAGATTTATSTTARAGGHAAGARDGNILAGLSGMGYLGPSIAGIKWGRSKFPS